jgi:hypothetical protein
VKRFNEEIELNKSYMDSPVVIRLAATAVDTCVGEIAKLIYVPLQRDLLAKLRKYNLSFSCILYNILPGSGRDFRYDLVNDLLPEPPWDAANTAHIERAFQSDDETVPDKIRVAARSMEGEDLAMANSHLAAILEADDGQYTECPWTAADMSRYIRIELPRRIYRMLDGDVATGKLVRSGLDKQRVLLDHLVEWATFRSILIEQDPLAKCMPLVVDSYNRLRQRMATAAAAPADVQRTPTATPTCIEYSASIPAEKPPQPMSRSDLQDNAILAAFAAKGLNPQCLPKAPPGHRTVKSAIRADLVKSMKQLFQSISVFDTAWQRLRDAGKVGEK